MSREAVFVSAFALSNGGIIRHRAGKVNKESNCGFSKVSAESGAVLWYNCQKGACLTALQVKIDLPANAAGMALQSTEWLPLQSRKMQQMAAEHMPHIGSEVPMRRPDKESA